LTPRRASQSSCSRCCRGSNGRTTRIPTGSGNRSPGGLGAVRVAFDEPRPGHRVRVEADGYLPAVSRAFKDDEGEVVYDVKLKKGAGLNGTVVGLDGKPLAGVTAVLVTSSQGS